MQKLNTSQLKQYFVVIYLQMGTFAYIIQPAQISSRFLSAGNYLSKGNYQIK